MNSAHYLIQGFKLIFRPGIRFYALTPLAINLLLYALMAAWLYSEFGVALDWAMEKIPDWLGFLVPIAWVLFSLSILLIFGYSFALLAAIIGSPFNGLLAEKVAEHRGGRSFDAPMTTATILALIRRSLWRELVKLGYFLPRIFGVFLISLVLGFIPVIGLAASALVFLWAAWSMCIQYMDYPADNDGIDFKNTIAKMKKQRSQCLLFGALITVLIGIPILNLFTMPAAVAGATLFWLEKIYDSGVGETGNPVG